MTYTNVGLSDCCGAKTRIIGGPGGTAYWRCANCGNPCDEVSAMDFAPELKHGCEKEPTPGGCERCKNHFIDANKMVADGGKEAILREFDEKFLIDGMIPNVLGKRLYVAVMRLWLSCALDRHGESCREEGKKESAKGFLFDMEKMEEAARYRESSARESALREAAGKVEKIKNMVQKHEDESVPPESGAWNTAKKILNIVLEEIIPLSGEKKTEPGVATSPMAVPRELVASIMAQGERAGLEKARERIRKEIWNPELERGERMPDDPERAADEAVSHVLEKVDGILASLSGGGVGEK